jgi:hypothetical protein
VSKPTGSKATLPDPTTATPAFVADVHGDYSAQLIVTDSLGAAGSPGVVKVNFNNVAPVAKAGLSQCAVVGQTVTLDGSGSSDANGDSLTYKWSLISAPCSSRAVISNPKAPIASLVPDLPGTLIAQLIVNDGLVDSRPATVEIESARQQTQVMKDIAALQKVIARLAPNAFKHADNQLRPATQYELRITDPRGGSLCDSWPLKTFPAPDAEPDSMRILTYTCAGGYDGPSLNGKALFLDMAARRRLLARGMSFRPDVVIANGDHIYWDMETSQNKPYAKFIREQNWAKFGGALDLSVPMLHPKNATIFTSVCHYQIPGVYGTTLRSTPAFFITDDRDTFENDEFDENVATMPPDTYAGCQPKFKMVTCCQFD